MWRNEAEYRKTIKIMDNGQFIAYFNKGITDSKRIGFEMEHFILDADNVAVQYSGRGGVEEILRKHMGSYPGAVALEEGNHLLGFKTESFKVSLEPGAQYEVSIAPCESVLVIRQVYDDFVTPLLKILNDHGYKLCTEGIQPVSRPEDIELIPKERYRLMDAYFKSIGTDAIEMMRGTAAVQVSVDYSSERDCARKMRAAQLLTPILQLLTENTYTLQSTGNPKPLHLRRAEIWGRTDPDRCEVARGLFDDDFGFSSYADYLSGVPMIVKGTDMDPAYLTSMVFPDVRLRQYVEIRGADSMDIDKAMAYAELIKQLMYSEAVLDLCENIISEQHIVDNDIKTARIELMNKGWDAEIYGRNAVALAREILNTAGVRNEPNLEPVLYNLSLPARIKKEYVAKIGNTEHEQLMLQSEQLNTDPILKKLQLHGVRCIDIATVPEIIDSEREDIFTVIADICYGICDKIIREYMTCPDYRKLFPFSTQLEELILASPMSSYIMPMARFDLFYHFDTGEYMVGEINTDGTAAMIEDCICARLLNYYHFHREMSGKYNLETFELFDSWVDKLLEIYRDTVSSNRNPHVAIVDFTELGYVSEFEEFQRCFLNAGIECKICDIRKLFYKNGKLYDSEGFQIDAIYRRAVTGDVLKHYDEVQAFIQAVLDKAVVLVGGFCTQVIHHKGIFQVMHLERTLQILNDEEREFIRRHIPKTVLFNNTNADIQEALEHKDRYVIKPCDSYGASNVTCGPIVDDETWQQVVHEAYGGDYILQEYCRHYVDKNLVFDMDDVRWSLFNTVTGLYIYGGKFSGVYTRQNFLNRNVGGGYPTKCLPCFRVRT